MKNFFLFVFLCIQLIGFSQNTTTYEKPPVFPDCETETFDNLKVCFNNKLNQFIFQNFKVPQVVSDDIYKGDVKVLFEVDKDGKINVIYVDAVYNELKEETKRVFAQLPKVQPSTYNGKPTYVQYSIGIKIPLMDPGQIAAMAEQKVAMTPVRDLNATVSQEYDSINKSIVKYEDLEYSSQLNIPFTHHYYARFDSNMNGLGTNSHTAVKPFQYEDVSKYYDFKAENQALIKGTDDWWSRKLWDEHLVEVQGKDYWFTIDPVFDLQIGKDTEADFSTTYNNTRGFYVQGGLGKKFNF